MGDLSPNFSRAEFKDRRTGHVLGPPPALVRVLESIRAITGEPLPITSGHRCTITNRLVGGAPRSRHVQGDAADIPRGRATVEQAAAAGARGIGSAEGWAIHVDTRPGPPARWVY